MSERIGPRIAPEALSPPYRPTGAVEIASRCTNVMGSILPVRLKRFSLSNGSISRRQPKLAVLCHRD